MEHFPTTNVNAGELLRYREFHPRESNEYIKADNDKLINEKSILWIKKLDECLAVCTKSTGCNPITYGDTHKVCKTNNPTSYAKLYRHFK